MSKIEYNIEKEKWLAELLGCELTPTGEGTWSIDIDNKSIGSIIAIPLDDSNIRYKVEITGNDIEYYNLRVPSKKEYYIEFNGNECYNLTINFEDYLCKITIYDEYEETEYYLYCSINPENGEKIFETYQFEVGDSKNSFGRRASFITDDDSIKYETNDNGNLVVAYGSKGSNRITVEEVDKEDIYPKDQTIEEYVSEDKLGKELLTNFINKLSSIKAVKKSLVDIIGQENVEKSGLSILLEKVNEEQKNGSMKS